MKTPLRNAALGLAVLGLATLGASCASSSTASDSGQHSSGAAAMNAEFTDASTTVTDSEPASPRKRLDASLGDVEITVDYGSPSAKGRDLWGALVPYDAVWRMGANEATHIETSGDLMVQGKRLPAGHYSMFAIPTAGEWTVIFNSQPAQWGAYNRDAALDVLIVMSTPTTSEMSESLEFTAGKGGTLMMRWGTLALPLMLAPAS
ncbi:hypothetical protein Poly30_45230 [Planctomycetes bacterium Poly30]|uniref:DUF2911 domain-containing protein n=1 Tax=Saltatorellus ferox TaxID=2528018 RepID=A0A518EY10_9BACT|nr:hypothetical protein Poly30_45230 [Planctomycetes bacterium Poly30]